MLRNMKFKKLDKTDILSLIKDDLIHTRLVYGLEKLGLNADNYTHNLSETIFKLLEIKDENEVLFEKYIEDCRTVCSIDIFKYPELLDSMAHRLYTNLTEDDKHKE